MKSARIPFVRWVSGGVATALLALGVLSGPRPAMQAMPTRQAFRSKLYFEPNHGQASGDVLMLARGSGGMVELLADGMRFVPAGASFGAKRLWQWKLVGSRPAAAVEGQQTQAGVSNYFVGAHPENWLTDLPHFSQAVYRQPYPGVDLVVHGSSSGSGAGELEYDFIVQPGADTRQLAVEFAGAESFALDSQGSLIFKTAGETITHRAPVAYQRQGDTLQYVASAYKIESAHPLRVGFALGEYDHSRELIIDPVVEYGRFFGGSQEDEILAISVDKAGYVYMTGETSSPDLPVAADSLKHTASVFQTKGNTLAFVAKLDPTGTKLIYCTYLGGSKTAVGHNIKIDAAGNAYIGGRTEASDFPLMKPIQAQFGGGSDDGFVAKLNAAGNALVYSTYIGGSEYDQGRALAVDAAGNAYLTGITESPNFPLKNPIQAKYSGKQDSFALKINAAGDALVYSTYLGGSGDDVGHAIAVDAAGAAYITGLSNSLDFPLARPLQRQFKGGVGDDTIVVKINPAGSAFVYSTYVGGLKDDEARAIAVDGQGNAVVTGYTQSPDFPLSWPMQADFGGGTHDVFAFSLQPDGSAFNWSTFLGGSGGDYGRGLALDGAGNVYLTGYTDSKNFPTRNPSQADYAGGSADVFYAKLDRTGRTLLLSSFLGGDAYERGRGMAVDARGNIYISGRTESKSLPVTKPHSPAFGGGPNDGFIVKIREK